MCRLAARLAAVLAGVTIAAPPAAAQTLFPRPGRPAARPADDDTTTHPRWRRVAGVSPIHVIFGSAAGDYEQAVTRDVSLGVGATFSNAQSILTTSTSGGYDVDVVGKLRYYLREDAPFGPSVGLLAGLVHGSRDRRAGADPLLPGVRRETAPAVGFTLDYNRAAGRSRRLVLGTGYGLKRRFATRAGAESYERIADLQYTIRFLAGVAW